MIHHNSVDKPVSGIILSGGFSNRFQQAGTRWQDKALLPVSKDESLLENTINILAEFCTEIVIMTSNLNQQFEYLEIIKKLPITIQNIIRIEMDDLNLLCKGPSRGLLSAINHVNNELVVITPVDVPFIYSKIFLDLLDNLADSSICVPLWPSGKIEPLIFAFNKNKIQAQVPLLAYNEYSRADDIFRLASSINFLPIDLQKVEIAEKIFTSINNPQEYKQIRKLTITKNESLFDKSKLITINRLEHKKSLTELLDYFNQNNFLKLTDRIITEGINYSKKFSEKNDYYYAGYILAFLLRSIIKNIDKTQTKIEELANICIYNFSSEAQNWENHNVKFLALHAYLDGYSISKLIVLDDHQKSLQNKIIKLREDLQLKEKQHNDLSFNSMFKKRLPNFIEKAKQIIRDAETAFNEQSSNFETDFLWDHSYRVGRIAYYIASHEGIDPFIPTIAAILHDAGKFVLGQYHADDISEEKHSSSIAEKLLSEEGLTKSEIKEVQEAITGLYVDQIPNNIACKVIYDADRLDKLGVLGIANYFTKMTLRGTNLSSSIIRSLSRELTYATSAPKTMLTITGKKLAERRANQTLNYFKELLMELQFYGLGKYYVKEFTIKDNQIIQLVIPEKCPKCKSKFVISLNTKTGLKCEKVIANYECLKCDNRYSIEFCLPLIITKKD
ncbi:MAG: HD domain-containing protein [Asgard group archaeon]|nr:HD domain-containing protein [Asgard group archaeon]